MAWTEPNTIIKLYRGINIDSKYENTLYFANVSEQNAFFHDNNPLMRWAFPRQTFQRVSKGKVRLEKNSELIDDCNYMAFQNSSYGTKWFYAFITDIEYINDITSEVTYEIDVMQTFLFDSKINACFVEREHSETDEAGDNIIEENLETGDYTYGTINGTGLFSNWSVMAQSPYDFNVEEAIGRASEGSVANGNNIMVFKTTASDKMANFQNWLIKMNQKSKIESISTLSMYPLDFCNFVGEGEGHEFDIGGAVVHKNLVNPIVKPTSIGSYVPRNKKLLTYPFTFLGVTTGDANIGKYRYEFFKSEECDFRISADPNTVTFMLIPINYNMPYAEPYVTAYNTIETLTMTNVPLCSYQGDTWKIWFGQNKSSLATPILSGLGTLAVGLATENPVMTGAGVVSTIGAVTSAVSKTVDHSAMPNFVKGTTGSGIGIGEGFQDFMFTQVRIHSDYANTIDSYFDMFGYATKKLKVPNRKVRQEWTYTKTIGCMPVCRGNGGAPASALRKIGEIYDNGIRFWVHNENVGDYTLDNSPLS